MNHEYKEQLSAYLDGALPPAERAELEKRLQNSPDLRRELEELRAVSKAVKGLPHESLPPAFLAHFRTRRAQPARGEWVFLPPLVRPIAFALSCGVVALVVWDKTVTTPDPLPAHSLNEAAVTSRRAAPVAQLDFSKRLSATAGSLGAAHSAIEASGVSGPVAEMAGRGDVAPRLKDAESLSTNTQAQRQALAPKAAAPGGPTDAPAAPERGSIAMSEEERSARNEQMFGFIEEQKKKMGIARVITKEEADERVKAPASSPVVGVAAPVLFKSAAASGPAETALENKPTASPDAGRLSADAGLVFSDAASLASSWVLLGFPGQPPTVDFSSNRVVLIKPSAAKILSVTSKPGSVDVVFRALTPGETSRPAADRAAVISREPQSVLLFDASPR